MRVISNHPKLSDFWNDHPDAETPHLAWHSVVSHTDWKTFADLKRGYPSASLVDRFVVFNIGGNKYRLIVVINYPKAKVYIHRVLTHKEYDRGKWKEE